MENLHCTITDALVNQIRKRDDRKHSNSGHISRTPETWILRKQLPNGPNTSDDRGSSTLVVFGKIFVKAVNICAGTPGVPEFHSPHFFQSAAIS
nr:hypothetical protein [Bradyrhizobium campsiandrae]